VRDKNRPVHVRRNLPTDRLSILINGSFLDAYQVDCDTPMTTGR